MLLHVSSPHSLKMIYIISHSVRTIYYYFSQILLLLGSYQIRMGKSYILEHLRQSNINEDKMEFIVELCREYDDLVRVRFHSRHSKQKRYVATVQFNEEDEQPIQGWYVFTCDSTSLASGCWNSCCFNIGSSTCCRQTVGCCWR